MGRNKGDKDLTDYEKGQIEGVFRMCSNYRETARQVGKNESTVQQYLQRAAERETHKSAPHTGCPTKYTTEDMHRLVHEA